MRLSFDQWLAHSYVPIAGAETVEQQPAEPAAEGGEAGQEPAAPEVDLSPVTDRMDEVMQRMGTLEERLPEAQQPPEDEFLGPGQGDPQWDAQQQQQQLDPDDPQAVLQFIRDEATRAAEARLQPEFERQATERRESESQQLLEDYPELQEQSRAQALVTDAQQWAQDIGRDIARGNPQFAQALASEPGFLELVHLAAQSAERAEQETPAAQSQDQVTLEGGAPTNPGGGSPQANLGEQIKAAGSRDGFWTG